MHFRWHAVAEARGDFVARWHALGRASSTPNIYLMPEFLLPAIRHLDRDRSARIAVTWSADRSEMLALAVLNEVPPMLKFPYRRLSLAHSRHSFQSGFLLRAGHESPALHCLLEGIFGGPWRALQFSDLRADTEAFVVLRRTAAERGLRWFADKEYERAALDPADRESWLSGISRARHNKLHKARERLRTLGRVETRVYTGQEVGDEQVENLLRLESLGWKSSSSLRGSRESEAFFREMCAGCRAQQLLWFCELSVDGKVIASTSNFCLGDEGFAFKIGIDPEYARFSPGFLVEYGFLEFAARHPMPFARLESGAQPGSYMEELWPGRIPMVCGHLVHGMLPVGMFVARERLQWVRKAPTRMHAWFHGIRDRSG